MGTQGRLWFAAAVAAGLTFAAYYGSQGDRTEELDPTREVRRDGAPSAEPAEQPVAEALLADQSEQLAEVANEGTSAEQPPSQDLDERIRAFTTPVERALAGIEDVSSKVALPASPEFKETLRQFAAENDDPNWSAVMEARIFGEIAQATGLRAGAIQVDCRTTLCRVLLTNPGSAPNPRYSSFNELVASFGLEEKWLLAVPDENGTPINFAYIERSDGTTTRSESP